MKPGILALLVCAALPLAAHHSFAATYDESKPVTLEGTASKMLLRNPHSFFSLEVTGADGTVTTWSVELTGAGSLMANGWTRSSLKDGDHVIVTGTQGKNQATRVGAFTVTLANGQVLKLNPYWGMGAKK
ncbi:MAG TPA: DUF6152 family protein [Bryobacteraceae bacterium]|jgi:thiamine monophosphate kinase